MKSYGLTFVEGGTFKNLTVDSGSVFPANGNTGELFFRSDLSELYCHNGITWENISNPNATLDLNSLSDVTITSPDNTKVLKYDGTKWIEYTLTKSDVGLSNVDNTSDVNKPVSTATQSALDTKLNISDYDVKPGRNYYIGTF